MGQSHAAWKPSGNLSCHHPGCHVRARLLPFFVFYRLIVPHSIQSAAFASSSRRQGIHPLWLALATSVWLATVGNIALWRTLFTLPEQASDAAGLLFAAAFAVLMVCLTMLVLVWFAWRGAIKPAAIVLLLMAGFGAHFMLLYRIVIDSEMIVNVFQTDMAETRDLLNLRLLVTVTVIAVLPALLIWRTPVSQSRSAMLRLGQNVLAGLAALVVFVGVLLASYQPMASLMRNHHKLRYMINPLNTVYALVDVGIVRHLVRPRQFVDIGQDATLGAAYQNQTNKPPLLLLVVGETARAGNFSLNGYARNTNPLLATDGVISFRNVWSCGTSTATALPCMFSHLGKEAYESRDNDYATLVDVLQHAGLAVLWVDNQPAGCKGICDRIPNVMTHRLQEPQFCADGECMDMVMLKDLEQRIAALPADRRAKGIVVVMHQMGSHGPAYSRRSDSETKAFVPECTTNVLQNCEHDQLINAYDNSIRYTDKFLHAGIAWLRQQENSHAPALIYLSDHGESLGEGNTYLHGLPYKIAPDVQKHVPLILWQSAAWQQRTGASNACLQGRINDRLTQDNLFHSVIGAMQVQTSLYVPDLDWNKGCQ